MLRSFDATVFKECQIPTEGEKASCLIPLMPGVLLDLSVRCEREVMVNMVTEDGQSIPMHNGKILNIRGVNRNFQAVEIEADTNFWYRALLNRTDEEVDPTPVSIELVQTNEDVLRSMIDERLRAWKIAQRMERELTEDEKDELVLDIAHGDLEFEDAPDPFGLGYEERMKEFLAEQKTADAEASDVPAPEAEKDPVKPAEKPGDSSST